MPNQAELVADKPGGEAFIHYLAESFAADPMRQIAVGQVAIIALNIAERSGLKNYELDLVGDGSVIQTGGGKG